MPNIKRLCCLFILGLFVAGCSSTKQRDVLTLENQGANVKLSEAATTISNTLTNVAAVQRATTSPLSIKPLPDPNTYGMDALASVDWSGPIEPLVRRIASASHYKLLVLGRAPAIPVLVAINDKNLPLGNILRDVDYQAGQKANIVVFPYTRTIELRYGRS